jgi:hypothetical protein
MPRSCSSTGTTITSTPTALGGNAEAANPAHPQLSRLSAAQLPPVPTHTPLPGLSQGAFLVDGGRGIPGGPGGCLGMSAADLSRLQPASLALVQGLLGGAAETVGVVAVGEAGSGQRAPAGAHATAHKALQVSALLGAVRLTEQIPVSTAQRLGQTVVAASTLNHHLSLLNFL